MIKVYDSGHRIKLDKIYDKVHSFSCSFILFLIHILIHILIHSHCLSVHSSGGAGYSTAPTVARFYRNLPSGAIAEMSYLQDTFPNSAPGSYSEAWGCG